MTLPKIEEWIKEVEERPASAQAILKLIAGRLRDLTERNEELLAENIALQDGSKVEEYTRRIAHLEYQLDLLKRRFGLNPEDLASLAKEPAPAQTSLLVYDAHGRILRLEPDHETGGLGRLTGEITAGGETPRLLAIPENDEMLLLFTTGRVGTCPVDIIPSMEIGGEWNLEQGSLPDEPHAGERLACILPLSNLPLLDYFLQASRRGCVKKTMTSMAETIFTNHFLGKGTIERLDQPHDLTLCRKQDSYALVTHEGRLLGLEVDALSYSVEERIKLDGTDHVIAGFTYQSGELIFCLTQTGKVITKDAGFVELAKTSASRGQALIPPGRLEQGVRFVGGAPFRAGDRVAVLDEDGNLTLQPGDKLISAGSVQTQVALAAFCLLISQSEKQAQP
jgi:DNA gyrase/topoisomerase IV subunit A